MFSGGKDIFLICESEHGVFVNRKLVKKSERIALNDKDMVCLTNPLDSSGKEDAIFRFRTYTSYNEQVEQRLDSVYTDRYEDVMLIGTGSSGEVRLAREKENGFG
ncbi:MAG: hypothetical protein EZS28_000166 [Streblomastix strix]|uniref:FHA domain-containing protein n=1 Tax=Streblomastix strix TaxID=222440 RepID=A0A5J4XAX5_9EUKA|nr:MAG: hypothetical protein EZS28_000166 [Streblomastix strix]